MKHIYRGLFISSVLCICLLTVHAQSLKSIFDFGKEHGWASPLQEKKLDKFLAAWTTEDQNKFMRFLAQAKTPSAKYFVLESWLAGDETKTLQKFITELNQYPEDYQQERCVATNNKSIIQQWQNTCSVTLCQTYLADICPRYAWDVKNILNYYMFANDANHPMAQQQKSLLEHYGGSVSVRGDNSGRTIGINYPLNEWVGLILGVRFYAQEIQESLLNIFPKIRKQVNGGLNVPLLIGFENSTNTHFILIMNYKLVNTSAQYLIYDPWDGKCNYVSEENLLRGSLSPLNDSWKIQIKYFYPTVELSQAEIDEGYKKKEQEFKN